MTVSENLSAANEERHYCLETLSSAKAFLLSAALQLPKLRAGYDEDREKSSTNLQANSYQVHDFLARLAKTVRKVQEEFIRIIHALNELEDDTEILQTAQKLNIALRKFKWLESNYDNVCGAITVFANELGTSYALSGESNINTAKLARLMNRVKMGYFPTDLHHVEMLKTALTFPQSNVNILDPCCGCGKALEAFANGENTVTYGVELDIGRAEKAEKILDRVGYGTYFHSRISNRAFHAVFLNPPYMSVMQQGGGSQRAERTFLVETLKYLMIGGVLVYIIPYYRLTEDICKVLAENFDDLRIYKFLEYEFKKYRQVVVIGKLKERDTETKTEANRLLSLSLNPENIPEITKLTAGTYILPNKETAVKVFKGAEFNVNELAHQLKSSDSIKHIFEKSKLDTLHRNPLLPLKVGQIGLIGGSGLMNGLVECDTPHIIKGRIVKQKTSESTEDKKHGVTEIREVTSNRMVFNVLTPFGYKSLT